MENKRKSREEKERRGRERRREETWRWNMNKVSKVDAKIYSKIDENPFQNQ